MLFLVVLLLVHFSLGCTSGYVPSDDDVKDGDGNTGDTMGKEKMIVVMETSKGNIEIELYEDKAPITTQNFLEYVNSNFYDGTVFHRVIKDFMVQCGGFTVDGSEKQNRAPIKNEADNGLKNEKGTLAMARTAVVDSATSQFFINVNDNSFLDHGARDYGYAVFGKVVKGYDVVESISLVDTSVKHNMQDWPSEDVVINKMYVKGL
ncbi:MAG: peptidylprolyl isomerase A [Candidatus Nanohalarchaeota archaeon]|nr:MAG: peptidylprolyl isomerase A [Candidatus Nanohaloarchaeota archaeon]